MSDTERVKQRIIELGNALVLLAVLGFVFWLLYFRPQIEHRDPCLDEALRAGFPASVKDSTGICYGTNTTTAVRLTRTSTR